MHEPEPPSTPYNEAKSILKSQLNQFYPRIELPYPQKIQKYPVKYQLEMPILMPPSDILTQFLSAIG